MRVARLLRNSANLVVTLIFVLLVYYLLGDKDTQNSFEKSVSSEKDGKKQRKSDAEKYRDQIVLESDSDFFKDADNIPGKREQNEGVVVVVVAGPGPKLSEEDKSVDKVSYGNEDSGVEGLEPPYEPGNAEIEEEDMLRDNDVMIGDVIIDRSDDLSVDINNSFESLNEVLHLGAAKLFENEGSVDGQYYTAAELLPPLKKPPSERNAPGEFGHPFEIPERVVAALRMQILNGYRYHGFNLVASDVISVHRNLGDRREQECKDNKYKKPLPTVSVIICFHNEALSALRRTFYSVLETVPTVLLAEIILVDDNSNLETLIGPLRREIADLGSLVSLIRSTKRLGITRARMMGAKKATGDVLAFLDSHCECYEGWIEPLLERISQNRTTIAIPVVEIIDPDTFKFSVTPMQQVQRGGFDWTLTFRWMAPPRERFEFPQMDMTEPIPTATMSGGVFCVEKNFFWDMGAYDSGLEIWGAENLEMSFRMWMCGGRLEIIPCSHVGHVFRSLSSESASLETVLKNKRRVAEVWLDDLKEVFFKRTPFAQSVISGNTTARENLRESLQCKSFQWYIENLYPELYIPELNPLHSGAVCCTFGHSADVCLDTHNTDAIPGRLICVDKYLRASPTQYFEYTKQDELRQTGSRDICLGAKGKKVEVQRCGFPVDDREMAPDMQRWEVTEDKRIMNFGTALCLTASINTVWLDKCDQTNKIRQTWKWK